MNITDIVANIDQRLADLDTELAHLTGARAALAQAPPTHSPAPVKRTPARRTPAERAPAEPTAAEPAPAEPAPAEPTPRRTRRAPVTPTYDVVPAGKLLQLLAAGDDMSTRELARTANADPDQVLVLLKEQEGAGEVRRTGTRAATRWHAITDEDRIAARVIELEAASRRPRARKT